MESKHERPTPAFPRRRVLGHLAAGTALAFAAGLRRASAAQAEPGACVVRPRHVEGPYFVDAALHRSDIRSDPRTGAVEYGVPLRLNFRVSHANGKGCLPLAGAQVDVWHCDADGLYSNTKEWQQSTIGQNFLRGYQITDKKGAVAFTTIFPGWYPNRAVHIHFKVRTGVKGTVEHEFTSQIFFDDALTDAIHAQPPYAQRGARNARNDRDLLFLVRGSRLILPLREDRKGYAGTFDITLDL